MSIVYLNGKYLPIENAQISVLDRGFLFGDGVYEVVPVFYGKQFRVKEHLNRLQRSINAVRIDLQIDSINWKNIFLELKNKNTDLPNDYTIYLQITRGPDTKRSHCYTPGLQPTIFVSVSPIQKISMEEYKKGFSAITLPDDRWANCYIKSINLLPNILAMQEAQSSDAKEAILFRDGLLVEGACSNVFIVQKEDILTPPLTKHMLGGVTRDLVIELAKKHGINCQETTIEEKRLHHADEIWITGSTKEIMPITKLDNKIIGFGKAGKIWERMFQYYQEHKKTL